MADSLKGQLLLASSDLFDPNFRRAVVLVTEHTDEGALGLVLNRPATVTVEEAVPMLAELVDDEELVRVGGPVEPGAVLALGEFDEPDAAATIVFDNVGFLPGDGDVTLMAAATRRARIFAGYSGWSAGQLESELEREDWIVEPATSDDVFAADDDDLWGDVLRRKGGAFTLLATMPLDPSAN